MWRWYGRGQARDYIEKKEDYERFGVQEYWLVDPRNEVVLVYVLENSKYRLFSSAEEQDIVRSSVLAGFETNLKEIFAEE
ncbi:Uma2 family endonuclease [Runella sp. MFBS21]|uniref:Uma2 family endonuclease n=1 Tax=Runella sp. MFBS21 TaxID=3034018 RepID=UPI0023F68261|nr:Uma2 family endonuclease [Runella sp. MFBS21]MDF7822317.1 Uma2 family endonuclease [Runella sp. MFBS21]